MGTCLRSGAVEDLRNGSVANVELGRSFPLALSTMPITHSLAHSLTHKGLKMARAQDGRAVGLGWGGMVGMRGATVVLGGVYIRIHVYTYTRVSV